MPILRRTPAELSKVYLIVIFLLQTRIEVVGHLPDGITGSITNSVMRILTEWKHCCHYLPQYHCHLLLTTLTDG